MDSATEDMFALSGREFEDEIVGYVRAEGFEDVRRVGGAGDLGADIRCRDEHGWLVVVECTRYRPEAKIGSPEIQTFFGMVAHHAAARGIFVTTLTFTPPARRPAHDRDIELIDGARLHPHVTKRCHIEQVEQEIQQMLLQRAGLRSHPLGAHAPSRGSGTKRIDPFEQTDQINITHAWLVLDVPVFCVMLCILLASLA